MIQLRLFLCIICEVLLLVACQKDNMQEEFPVPDELTIEPASVVLAVGESCQLIAKLNGIPLDGSKVRWESNSNLVNVDEDGKAYHIYSSEENLTLQIAELSDDYLSHTGNYVRVAPAGHNEAPAIFKKDGTYWMITSGCTGWAPNEARMFSSSSIFGPWSQHPNPCVGPKSELTFGGQSTYILKVEGKKDAFIFMADIWRPEHPSDARYIWLPVQFKEGIPYVEWMDNWTLDFFQ